MTADTIINIFYAFGFIILYLIIGFGPGFVIGVMLGNITGGRGKDSLRQQHELAKKAASEHNSQWHPSHQRWQHKS